MDEAERPLMFDTYRSLHEIELRWRHPPWVPMSDRPPPGPGTYMVSVRDADGREYPAFKYWSVPVDRCQRPTEPYWADVGPYIEVTAWCVSPLPWDGVVREEAVRLPD